MLLHQLTGYLGIEQHPGRPTRDVTFWEHLPGQYRDDPLPIRVAMGIFGLWLLVMLGSLVGWLVS